MARGMTYSVILFLFVSPIFIYCTLYLSVIEGRIDQTRTEIIGDELIYFMDSVKSDLHRSVTISGKTSLLIADQHVIDNGVPLDNSQLRLAELMLNHTLYGADKSSEMNFNNLYEWSQRVESAAQYYGLNASLQFVSLTVKPYDNWNINFQAKITVDVSVSDSNTRINRTMDESVIVPISGFADPLYSLNTNGLLTRTLFPSNIIPSNVLELDSAAKAETYINSSTASCFLDRLEGHAVPSGKYEPLSPYSIGLETIVNISAINAASIPVKMNQSVIDYLYFDNATHYGYDVVNSTYSWMYLDFEHAAKYNVTVIP